jgi:hypothetical protein
VYEDVQKSAELRYDIVLYCTTDAAVFNEF